ncbi:MAG: glycosyltransferase family 2 protein [Alphaproteobacteria bacterium GM202ARS2]|nr:glycosyltransferase family 2 protein [Alphaproteobacteria bacterium GM202ARS2]
MTTATISVIVPFYNEADNLPTFHDRLSRVIESLTKRYPYTWEIVYVDDGSNDNALDWLQRQQKKDRRITLVQLSRNFGKEAALSAGADLCQGDAAIFIDADLQDPPELIPQLIEPWHNKQADIVYARRLSRKGESWLKKVSAALFYKVLGRLTHITIPPNTGDFRLMSRETLDQLNKLREHHRFMKGLFAWVGYRQKEVLYHREARHLGRSKWNYRALWRLSLEGITSFSTMPLTLATYLGLIAVIGALIYAALIIYQTLMYGTDVPGYPSLMVTILFMGGAQMLTIGILGAYIGRIFNEVKQRPLYLVKTHQRATQKMTKKKP